MEEGWIQYIYHEQDMWQLVPYTARGVDIWVNSQSTVCKQSLFSEYRQDQTEEEVRDQQVPINKNMTTGC